MSNYRKFLSGGETEKKVWHIITLEYLNSPFEYKKIVAVVVAQGANTGVYMLVTY